MTTLNMFDFKINANTHFIANLTPIDDGPDLGMGTLRVGVMKTPPKVENKSVYEGENAPTLYGARIGLCNCSPEKIVGLDFGMLGTTATKVTGIQWGTIWASAHESNGLLQFGIMHFLKEVGGPIIGAYIPGFLSLGFFGNTADNKVPRIENGSPDGDYHSSGGTDGPPYPRDGGGCG